MSGSSNRFFLSLPEFLLKYIDETVEVLNTTKEHYKPKVNRQSVIRGIIRYCKNKNPQFSSGWSKHVSVMDKKISE